jgi:DNA-directed RNA polymerase specialized sigma24 family protein
MLRRYMRYSHDTGRLPSILGREFFRTKVTRHTAVTFEDRVIFVHDMETCLHRLDEFSQKVIGRIVLQEYGHEEAAQLLGCARMTVHRVLVEALDKLGSILLRVGLIERLHWRSEKSCQGGNLDNFLVSDCKYDE